MIRRLSGFRVSEMVWAVFDVIPANRYGRRYVGSVRGVTTTEPL